MIEINKMTVDQIKDLIEELKNKVSIYSKTKEAICQLVSGNRDYHYCPKCGSNHIVKNGKTNNKQNYLCKDCHKKFNTLTGTLFSGLNLTYEEAEVLFDNTIACTSIRNLASLMKKSTKTIFTLRHKIMSCINHIVNEVKLTGNIELDELYLSINLKGTKKEKMPRISKKRSSSGKGIRGISKHKVCITSGIDEFDNLFFSVAGTSSVTSEMIENTVANRIENSTKIITDCKSSYESVAKKHNWNLSQVKSQTHVNENGDNLANINNLHQHVQAFLSGFRNVSTKHLQQYLDLFSFVKILSWKYEYSDLLKVFRNKISTLTTNVKYNNVCSNFSIFDFEEIYSDYNFHPSNSTT